MHIPQKNVLFRMVQPVSSSSSANGSSKLVCLGPNNLFNTMIPPVFKTSLPNFE